MKRSRGGQVKRAWIDRSGSPTEARTHLSSPLILDRQANPGLLEFFWDLGPGLYLLSPLL